MTFSLPRYLDRIGLSDVPEGADGLVALQKAQMSAIPFENIDPLLGTVPSLAPADVVDKLVTRRRGGYCFEQNALFGLALVALGYRPRPLLARVRSGAPEGGARSHQAFIVEAGGEAWLCDTGFGGHGALQPLRIVPGAEQATPNGTYRLVADAAAGETLLERRAGVEWVSLYGFDGTPVRPVDMEAANFLCARWEGAPFSTQLMLAFHGPAGRIALFNRALTRGQPPEIETQIVETEAALARVLREDFTLHVTEDEAARIWAKIKDNPTRRQGAASSLPT